MDGGSLADVLCKVRRGDEGGWGKAGWGRAVPRVPAYSTTQPPHHDCQHQVGRIPENVLSRITARVLQGLSFLHRKHLVHRDIKPANILVNLQGEAKISDFGISAFVANTVANVGDGRGWWWWWWRVVVVLLCR